MNVKLFEVIVSVNRMKAHSAKVLRLVAEGKRPVLLTSCGRGVAVVQSLVEYERQDEERAFMRAVVQGLRDVDKGRTVGLLEAETRLGLK